MAEKNRVEFRVTLLQCLPIRAIASGPLSAGFCQNVREFERVSLSSHSESLTNTPPPLSILNLLISKRNLYYGIIDILG